MTRELPFLMRTYHAPTIGFVRGRDAYLFDRAGRRYLDFVAGLVPANVGGAGGE